MRFLIILGFVLALAVADNQQLMEEMKAHLLSKLENCAKEEGASAEDLNALKSHTLPASREGKCVIFCMHKLFNMQNDDGSINLDGALETLEMLKEIDVGIYEKMVTITKNCATVPVDSDPCITAASMGECGAKEAKTIGIESYFE